MDRRDFICWILGAAVALFGLKLSLGDFADTNLSVKSKGSNPTQNFLFKKEGEQKRY